MSLIRTRGAIAAARKWTPMDELLTGKDLDTIARAHRHCREMEIERTLGALRVRVSTCPATRAWSVPYSDPAGAGGGLGCTVHSILTARRR